MLESFRCQLTGYFGPPYESPEQATMEGGGLDCHGRTLHTLQEAAEGTAPWFSVAAAKGVFPDMTPIVIPSLNETLGKQIEGRIVDVGSPHYFSGRSHLDVCVSGKEASLLDLVNRENVLVVALMPEVDV